MESHILLIEIVALATGLTVIIIETVIIFMLKHHISALKSNFAETDKLITKLESEMDEHMDHLNEHSHKIEFMLKSLCDHEAGLHGQNPSRLEKSGEKFQREIITRSGKINRL